MEETGLDFWINNTATLVDCFIYMIKLIAIYRLSNLNPFKRLAIRIFNQRYTEFQHPAYLLYFIHILYRGCGLRNGGFREAALTASKMWHSLNYSEQECKELIAQLRRFELKLDPYDLSY
ncbi:11139_t:CDS:2, partial [Diversispora eburnea]